ASVGLIDLRFEARVRWLESHVPLHAAAVDSPLARVLTASEPRRIAALDRPDIEAVPVKHRPDRHRLAQRAIAPVGGDVNLLGPSQSRQLVALPVRHSKCSFRHATVCSWIADRYQGLDLA